MKNNEKPDILNRIKGIKLRRELTVLLAFMVMLSTSYAMIHPGEALNNSTARSFMFFNEEDGVTEETAVPTEAPDMNALLDADRDSGAVEEVPAEETPAEEVQNEETAAVTEEAAFEPTSTPAETVVPTLAPTVTPENTAEATGTPETLESADPAVTAEAENTSDPFSTASTEPVIEEISTPEAAASASPEPSASATPEATASVEPTATPEAEAEEVLYPAVDFGEITPLEEDGTETIEDIKVVIKAPEGAFPEGTTVNVVLVRDTEVLEAIEKAAVDAAEDNVEVKEVKAVDITFTYKGEEIQPKKAIAVSFKSSMIEESNDTTVVHVEQDKENDNQIVEAKAVNKIEAPSQSELVDEISDNEVVIEAESFSVYGIVGTYTVDFHYLDIDFSIIGESSIHLSELFEILEVEENADDAKTVEFTNPELIQIEKEEKDWLLTSLKPFDSTETLTVTMNDGTVYVIEVTDAQEDLPTKDLTITKTWVNTLTDDNRTAENSISFDVYQDDTRIRELTLNRVDDTHSESATVSVSFGSMIIDDNGNLVIEDAGHDYALSEAATYNYRWELHADTIHPMVIGEEEVILVQTDSYPDEFDSSDITYYPSENPTYYKINGSVYKISDITNEWSAVNYRRSNLNVTKVVDGSNPNPDTLFHYHMTVYDWSQEDIWFSVMDAEGNLVTDLDTDAAAEEGNTGYYYFDSHSTLEIGLKEDWNLRFTNLKSGTTFSITEVSQMGYEFNGATVSPYGHLSVIGSTVVGIIEDPCEIYQISYKNRIVESYPETSTENVRTHKWAELTEIENEFLIHLSIDQKKTEIAEFFGPGHWYSDTSNDAGGHGTPLFTIEDDENGSFVKLGDVSSGYSKHTTVTVIDSSGNVLIENLPIYWDHGDNFTLWCKLADNRYMLLGRSVKSGKHVEVGLTQAAEELIYGYTEDAVTLRTVSDQMGPAVIYLDSAQGDGTVAPSTASTSVRTEITWTIAPKDPDDCEHVIETIESGGTTTTTTWYKNIAELTYRIRLDPTAAAFVNGASVINEQGTAAFVENNYSGTSPVSDYLNAANDHATLTYDDSEENGKTLDFPIPYIRGTTYTFNFTKEDQETRTALAGAKFKIVDNDNLYTNAPEDGWTAEADENGIVTFTGIPYSTNLYLTETEAPENYEITFEGLTIENLGILEDLGDSEPDNLDYHKYDSEVSPEYEFLGVYRLISTTWAAAQDMPDQADKWTITDKKNSQLVDLLKVDAEDNTKTLDGAIFELYSDEELTTKAKNTKGEEIGTLTTANGGKADIGRLAVGTYYLVETTAPDNYMLAGTVKITVSADGVTYEQSEGNPITAQEQNGTYTLIVKDTRKKASVTITKVLEDNYSDKAQNFIFTTTLKDGDADITESISGLQSFTLLPGNDDSKSITFADIPVGSVLQITETSTGQNELNIENYSTAATATGVTLSKGTASRTYSFEVVETNNEIVVTFTNTRKTIDVNVLKVDESSTALPGASFSLTQVDGDGHDITGGIQKPSTQVGSDGKLTFKGLTNGRYKLEETVSPDGYIKTSESPIFKIKIDEESGDLIVDYTDTAMVTYDSATKTFTVKNVAGQALPNTGGPGTLLYTLSGIALMLGAALMYGFRMRRRERRLINSL